MYLMQETLNMQETQKKYIRIRVCKYVEKNRQSTDYTDRTDFQVKKSFWFQIILVSFVLFVV